MAFDALDAPDSPLARFDPRWKLAALVIAGACISVVQTPPFVLAAFVAALGLLLIARLPRELLMSRLSAFGLFLLPFVLILPFLNGWDGLTAATLVAARAATLFMLALVLTATAPLHRNLQAAQALGVPRALTQIMLMSYRYLFVMRDEFVRLRTAMRARGFRAGTNARTLSMVGHVAGMLLVRGEERGQRVAQAMRCRGFDGRFRSLSSFRTRGGDVIFFAVTTGAATALLIGDWLLRS